MIQYSLLQLSFYSYSPADLIKFKGVKTTESCDENNRKKWVKKRLFYLLKKLIFVSARVNTGKQVSEFAAIAKYPFELFRCKKNNDSIIKPISTYFF
jgi:hypothetical protein